MYQVKGTQDYCLLSELVSKSSLSLAVLVRVGVLVMDQSSYSLIVIFLVIIGDGSKHIYTEMLSLVGIAPRSRSYLVARSDHMCLKKREKIKNYSHKNTHRAIRFHLTIVVL